MNITASCKKASNIFNQLSLLHLKTCCNLYKTFARSKLEYGTIIWGYAVNSHGNRASLDNAQRTGLRRIIQATPSTPGDALECELNVPPIDLRIQELQRMEYIKLLRKPDNNTLKEKIMSKTMPTKPKQSPIDNLKHVGEQLYQQLKKQNPDLKLEPEPPTIYDSLLPDICLHNMDLKIGNAHSRTIKQMQEGKEIINQQLLRTSIHTIVAFTDGSAAGNPGPTGAGAVILTEGLTQPPIKLSKAVSPSRCNVHGELVAIELAATYVNKHTKPHQKELQIFTDCKPAIQSTTSLAPPCSYHETVSRIRKQIELLQSKRQISVSFYWTPAHAEISLNDMADSLAKTGAKLARKTTSTHTVTIHEAKRANQQLTTRKWNQRWARLPAATNYRTFITEAPCITGPKQDAGLQPLNQRKMVRLRLGHSYLASHRAVYTPDLGKTCDGCSKIEDIRHIFFECHKHDTERMRLMDNLELALGQDPTCTDTTITCAKIIGLSQSADPETKKKISKAASKCLLTTKVKC